MKKLNAKSEHIKRVLLIFGILVILCYAFFMFKQYGSVLIDQINPEKRVKDFMQIFAAENPLNFLILIVLTSLATAIPFMSISILAIFNGVVFGPWIALGMNVIANIVGNSLLLTLLSKINMTEKEKKLNARMESLAQMKNKYLALTLGYMMPVIPTFMVDYMALEMKLPWYQWLFCVFIGVLPSSVLYAFGGDAIIDGNVKRLIGLALIIVLIYLIYKIINRKKKI